MISQKSCSIDIWLGVWAPAWAVIWLASAGRTPIFYQKNKKITKNEVENTKHLSFSSSKKYWLKKITPKPKVVLFLSPPPPFPSPLFFRPHPPFPPSPPLTPPLLHPLLRSPLSLALSFSIPQNQSKIRIRDSRCVDNPTRRIRGPRLTARQSCAPVLLSLLNREPRWASEIRPSKDG